MSGIQLAVSVHEVKESAVNVLTAEHYFVAQVMTVSALAIDNFTEKPLLYHIENRHFLAVVAAVFKQHAEFTRLFARVNKLPALLYRSSAAGC